MIFYKVRHKASGLFYKPSSGVYDINLSKIGRVYQRRPSLSYGHMRLGFGDIGKPYSHENHKKEIILVTFNAEDWELLRFETTEVVVPW